MCIGRGGALKVSKGSLIMMRDNKKNNLYVLKGSIVVDSSIVSSFSDYEKSGLWHMRLDHMSERGMNILSKHGLLYGKHIVPLDFCEHCVFGKVVQT